VNFEYKLKNSPGISCRLLSKESNSTMSANGPAAAFIRGVALRGPSPPARPLSLHHPFYCASQIVFLSLKAGAGAAPPCASSAAPPWCLVHWWARRSLASRRAPSVLISALIAHTQVLSLHNRSSETGTFGDKGGLVKCLRWIGMCVRSHGMRAIWRRCAFVRVKSFCFFCAFLLNRVIFKAGFCRLDEIFM
jgi:hypothetical protein